MISSAEEDVANQLADRIRYLRAHHKLTLNQMATRAGVPAVTIARLEKGREFSSGKPSNPHVMTIYKIANALDMTMGQLLEGIE